MKKYIIRTAAAAAVSLVAKLIMKKIQSDPETNNSKGQKQDDQGPYTPANSPHAA